MSIRKRNLSFKKTFKTLPLSTTKQKYFQLFSEASGVTYKVASVDFMDSYNLYAYADDERYQIVDNSFISLIKDLQTKIKLFNRKNKTFINSSISIDSCANEKIRFVIYYSNEGELLSSSKSFIYNEKLDIWKQSCIAPLLVFFKELEDKE